MATFSCFTDDSLIVRTDNAPAWLDIRKKRNEHSDWRVKWTGWLPLLCVMALLLPLSAGAARVSGEKALQVATAYMPSAPLRSAAPLQLVHAVTGGLRAADADTLLFVYQGQDGFVIVSGDDGAHPVLGYAQEGAFGGGVLPPSLSYWLDVYAKQMVYARSADYVPSEALTREWDEVLAGNHLRATPTVALSTALWDQESPFNAECPKIPQDTGVPAPTGCVATAMAIVMKYHNHPSAGTGTKPSYLTLTEHIRIPATSFSGKYDWNNMPTKAADSSWTATQKKAVAHLVYHCGVAVEMDFLPEASGAYSNDMHQALIENFKYDAGAYLAYRDAYTSEDWQNLIRAELNAKRPVLYSGITQMFEGHMFMVDGYTDNYYHINWGWSGIANGNYLLSALEPSASGTGGALSGTGFAFYQEALLGVKPAVTGSAPRYEFFFMRSEGLDYSVPEVLPFADTGLYADVDSIRQGEPFHFYYAYLCNYSYREYPGTFAVYLEDKTGKRKELLETFTEALPGDYVMYEPDGLLLKVTATVQEGDRIRLYYKEGNIWQPVTKGLPGSILTLPVYPASEAPAADVSLPKQAQEVRYADGQLHISGYEGYTASLYDLTGRLLTSRTVTASPFTLPYTSATLHILSLSRTGDTSFRCIIR
jgi:hypothetical protein